MQTRINPFTTAPDVMKAMQDLEQQTKRSSLEHALIELVKTRASQINGCAYCLHMHTKDARTAGESEERLYLLNAWRESRLYTVRERAALEWTEALTLIAETGAPDQAYQTAAAQFSPKELAELTLLISTINAWNRFSVGFRAVHPDDAKHAAAA